MSLPLCCSASNLSFGAKQADGCHELRQPSCMLQELCRFQVHVRPEPGEPDGFIAQVFQAGKQGAWSPQLVHAIRMFKDSFGGSGFNKSSKTWSFRAADRIEDLRAAVEWSGADAELIVNPAFNDRPGVSSTQQSLSNPNSARSHQAAQDVASIYIYTQSQQSQSSYGSGAACATMPGALQQHARSSYSPQEAFGSLHPGSSHPRTTPSQDQPGSPWNNTHQAPHSHTSTADATAGSAHHISPPQHLSWPEDDPEALDTVVPAAFGRLGSMQPVQQVAYGRSPDGRFQQQQQQQQQQGSAASQPLARPGYSASQVIHSSSFEHRPAGLQSHAGLQNQLGHSCSNSHGEACHIPCSRTASWLVDGSFLAVQQLALVTPRGRQQPAALDLPQPHLPSSKHRSYIPLKGPAWCAALPNASGKAQQAAPNRSLNTAELLRVALTCSHMLVLWERLTCISILS